VDVYDLLGHFGREPEFWDRLVLPAEIRWTLGIHPGDRLIVELEGDHAVIRKAPHSDIMAERSASP